MQPIIWLTCERACRTRHETFEDPKDDGTNERLAIPASRDGERERVEEPQRGAHDLGIPRYAAELQHLANQKAHQQICNRDRQLSVVPQFLQ